MEPREHRHKDFPRPFPSVASMDPSNKEADIQPHEWDEHVNGEDDWSSESDQDGAPAGYMLLQNEEDSTEEADQDFDPRDASVEGYGSESVEQLTITTEQSLGIAFKAISPEEEERLRQEAFAQFDRNYTAVRLIHPRILLENL